MWSALALIALLGLVIALGCAVRTIHMLFVERRAPLLSPNDPPLAEEPLYDFIIVGGGSAGAVLAARLAESTSHRVVLLEAGEEDKGPFFKVPLAALGFQATSHHWAYEAEEQDHLTMKGEHWGAGDGCSGRPLIMCRGKALGGSSSLNLCNYIRGHAAEFDAWADQLGLDGWSYRDLIPHFRSAEELRGKPPEEDEQAEPSVHEPTLSPAIVAERVQSAHPISRSFVALCKRALGGAKREATHAIEAPAEGAALHWVSISKGIRCSNTRLLHGRQAAKARSEGRLRVETGCRVLKILIAKKDAATPASEGAAAGKSETAGGGGGAVEAEDASLRAVGVLVRTSSGQVLELRASREVILCAGAINTPQLLLLSGVGERDELAAAGVDLAHHLPGVGKSLRDTAAVGLLSHTSHTTLDKQLRTPWPYLRYLFFRGGPLASNTLEASAWISERRLAKHMATPISTSDEPKWDRLSRLIESKANDSSASAAAADGAASAFSHWARFEAAFKLIQNHKAIVGDVANPSPAPTQAHLRTVPAASASFVDEAIREVARRLIGGAAADEKVDLPTDSPRLEAWAGTTKYLRGRIQTTREQRPGRAPDLSPEAGAAMRAVLSEVGSLVGVRMEARVDSGSAAPTTHEAPPAMQLLVQPMLFPFASWGKFRHLVEGLKAGKLPSAFTVHVVLLRPRSTGEVRLQSAEPLAPPLIDPNYFSDESDLEKLVAGLRLVRSLIGKDGCELRPTKEILPGETLTLQHELKEYVRANACHFNGSLCGSCRMGSDELAVVDSCLRVRGVSGLRIADASVMPTLVSGQLNAAVTAIAERAASLIAKDHAPPTHPDLRRPEHPGADASEPTRTEIRMRRPAAAGYTRL